MFSPTPPTLKALVFDLDGTAVQQNHHALPSPAVIAAVTQAKKYCQVSVATGRPLEVCAEILDTLEIDDLCILNGGTHLYSRRQQSYVWKQEVEPDTLNQLFFQLKGFTQYQVADEKNQQRVAVSAYQVTEPIGLTCIFAVTQDDAVKIVSLAKEYPELSVHASTSWQPHHFDIHISHELANKKHALQSLLARWNVDHDQTMVVGDSGNDLPLFELAGWKVAMGNATPELKSHADWIAPTVDEDGLAVAINTFITLPPLARGVAQ